MTKLKPTWRLRSQIPPEPVYPPMQTRLPWPFDSLPQFADSMGGAPRGRARLPSLPKKGSNNGPPCNGS